MEDNDVKDPEHKCGICQKTKEKNNCLRCCRQGCDKFVSKKN